MGSWFVGKKTGGGREVVVCDASKETVTLTCGVTMKGKKRRLYTSIRPKAERPTVMTRHESRHQN